MWTQWHTAPWCSGSNFAVAHTSDRCAAKPAKDTDLPLSLTHTLYVSLLPPFSSLSAFQSSCMAKTAHAQHSAGGVLLTTGRLTSLWEKAWKKWERERDLKRERKRESLCCSLSLPPPSYLALLLWIPVCLKDIRQCFFCFSMWCFRPSLSYREEFVNCHRCTAKSQWIIVVCYCYVTIYRPVIFIIVSKVHSVIFCVALVVLDLYWQRVFWMNHHAQLFSVTNVEKHYS